MSKAMNGIEIGLAIAFVGILFIGMGIGMKVVDDSDEAKERRAAAALAASSEPRVAVLNVGHVVETCYEDVVYWRDRVNGEGWTAKYDAHTSTVKKC